MIFVDRTDVPVPKVFLSSVAYKAREKILALLSSATQEHLAQLRVTFEPSIWMRAKPDLLQLFCGKCAYCESPISAEVSGDIEHFRPKQGAQNLDGAREQLFYSWLAYEWDNLLIVCVDCNRMRRYGSERAGKAERFPVDGPRASMLSDVATCRATEIALLLDPCFDRPDEHLAFESGGTCRPLSQRGRVTIEILGLNMRESLVHARKNAWEDAAWRVQQAARSGPPELDLTLRELKSVDRPYSAAVRAALIETLQRLQIQTSDLLPPSTTTDPLPRIETLRLEEPIVPSLPPRYKGLQNLPRQARDRIVRIEIRNFKAIEVLDLDFTDGPGGEDDHAPALMILGENATGKSSILQAVALTLLGTDEIASLKLRGEDFLHRSEDWHKPTANDPPAEVRIIFESEYVQRLTIDPATCEFRGSKERATVLLGYGPRRYFAEAGGDRHPRAPAARVKTLFDPTAIITNPSAWMLNCSDTYYDQSIGALRKILALNDEAFVARPAKEFREGAQIMLQVQGNSTPLDRLSDGYKTIVALGIDVMREMLRYWPYLETARGVVIIDEVETHLHPRWKMRIMRRLREAMPQVQFIVTTHDPLCLRGMYDQEVQVLRRDANLHIERVLSLPNVRGLTVQQLLTSDLFGLFSTEEPAIEEELARYAALAVKRERTPAEERELKEHRSLAAEKLQLGNNPAAVLVQDAASAYFLRLQQAPETMKADIKREAVEEIIALWNSDDPAGPDL